MVFTIYNTKIFWRNRRRMMDYFLGMFWSLVVNAILSLIFRFILVWVRGGIVWVIILIIFILVINLIIIYKIRKENPKMARGWSLMLALGAIPIIIIFMAMVTNVIVG
jgi:hypothetical protein